MNWWRIRRTNSLFMALVLSLYFLAGCGLKETADQAVGVADRAVSVLDRGIDRILANSDNWRFELQRVSQELPSDVQSTIRIEAQDLVSRSIADAGTEMFCASDFYGRRAIQSLERLKAMVLGYTVQAIEPGVCALVPTSLDMNTSADRRRIVTLHGYDMDARDRNGNLIQVFARVGNGGHEITVSEDRIGRTHHYLLTVNVSGDDFESLLRREGIVKLIFRWGETSFPYEVVVIQRQQMTETRTFAIESLSHTPSRTRGDGDFDTDDGNPMAFQVAAESRWYRNALQVRAYMFARETEDDYTTVESWSEWKTVFFVEPGFQIVSFAPVGPSQQSGRIIDHSVRNEYLPVGELVERFEIFGDTDDDEAGTYTRVIVHFHPMQVTVARVTMAAGMEWNTDRPGGDIGPMRLTSADPNLCKDACERNANCRAWTYVAGRESVCWLKSGVPNPQNSICCISGIK